jgi:hypothetical protein
MYILIVTSGEYRGRFVGWNLAGLARYPEWPSSPEIPITGTGYSLFLSEDGASHFLKERAGEVQQELRQVGIETALAEWADFAHFGGKAGLQQFLSCCIPKQMR